MPSWKTEGPHKEPVLKMFTKSGCSDWKAKDTQFDHFVPLTAEDQIHKTTFPLPTKRLPAWHANGGPFSQTEISEDVKGRISNILETLLRDSSPPLPFPEDEIPVVGRLDFDHGTDALNIIKAAQFNSKNCRWNGNRNQQARSDGFQCA